MAILPEAVGSYVQLGFTLLYRHDAENALRAVGYPLPLSSFTSVKWRYSAERPRYQAEVGTNLRLLLQLPFARLQVIDTDFSAAQGGGYLGYVQAWLLDLDGSASSRLLPAHQVVAELRGRLANCTALVQEQEQQQLLLQQQAPQGGELTPPPPPPPPPPWDYDDGTGCPLKVGNATLIGTEDETPPSPPVQPPPPQPPLAPPSPSLPPNLQCVFTECEAVSDEEVQRREAEAVGSGARGGGAMAAPQLAALLLAVGASTALGCRRERTGVGVRARARHSTLDSSQLLATSSVGLLA